MKIHKLTLSGALALALAAAANASVAQQDRRIELPDLGNSAANYLSDGEEREYARAILMQMRAFDIMVEAGYGEENAYFECVHELKLITDLLHRHGLGGLRNKISGTASYGGLTRGPRIIDENTYLIAEALPEIVAIYTREDQVDELERALKALLDKNPDMASLVAYTAIVNDIGGIPVIDRCVEQYMLNEPTLGEFVDLQQLTATLSPG